MDAVTGPLEDLAAETRRAGVTLGMENTIAAEDDLRIIDSAVSPDLKIYYGIGNAANLYGADPAREIRVRCGQICQFHFKDKTYLGEGKADGRAALRAIGDIGFRGAIVLETGSPSRNVESGLLRSRQYLTGLLGR